MPVSDARVHKLWSFPLQGVSTVQYSKGGGTRGTGYFEVGSHFDKDHLPCPGLRHSLCFDNGTLNLDSRSMQKASHIPMANTRTELQHSSRECWDPCILVVWLR